MRWAPGRAKAAYRTDARARDDLLFVLRELIITTIAEPAFLGSVDTVFTRAAGSRWGRRIIEEPATWSEKLEVCTNANRCDIYVLDIARTATVNRFSAAAGVRGLGVGAVKFIP